MELLEKLKSMPTNSGVYLYKDKKGTVIYVGKAKNLKKRVNQYFDGIHNKQFKTIALVQNIVDINYIVVESEKDALVLENNLIKKYQPKYNILLKDSKTFPYIKVNINDDYPRLEITRIIKNDGAKYFGPYLAGIRAKDVLDIITTAFQVKTCKKLLKKPEKRECLNFFLGKCSAPCTNKISKEGYKKIIEDVLEFLKGNTTKAEKILQNKMQIASENLQFERAIELRNLIDKLSEIKNKITTQFVQKISADIIGFYSLNNNSAISISYIRQGKLMGTNNYILLDSIENQPDLLAQFLIQTYEQNKIIPSEIYFPVILDNKKEIEEILSEKCGHKIEFKMAVKGKFKTLTNNANINAKEYLEKNMQLEKLKNEKTIGALETLQKILSLKNFPKRIECYDISNISGTDQVASMVVMENGVIKKSDYRKFKIKTVVGPNDFESLKEVIIRRMNELKLNDVSFSKCPDLMVIDGGKGQLSSVSNVLRKLNSNIDLISLAKKEEQIFIENDSNPVELSKRNYSLQLLIRLRDEAHRFAITFHRQRRNKTMLNLK